MFFLPFLTVPVITVTVLKGRIVSNDGEKVYLASVYSSSVTVQTYFFK
jgi:hypothetical protein